MAKRMTVSDAEAKRRQDAYWEALRNQQEREYGADITTVLMALEKQAISGPGWGAPGTKSRMWLTRLVRAFYHMFLRVKHLETRVAQLEQPFAAYLKTLEE